jgi:hypothetical protein
MPSTVQIVPTGARDTSAHTSTGDVSRGSPGEHAPPHAANNPQGHRFTLPPRSFRPWSNADLGGGDGQPSVGDFHPARIEQVSLGGGAAVARRVRLGAHPRDRGVDAAGVVTADAIDIEVSPTSST